MKIALTVLVAVVGVVVAQQQGYTGRWNNINTKEIIDNTRLFNKYKQCILADTNVGCPQEVVDLKKVLPDALQTVCSKCTPPQVEKIRETLLYACQKRKPDFLEILHHVDPQGIYRPQFEAKFGTLSC